MAFDDWLDEATAADLDGLAACLLDGRIPSAGAAGSVQLAGFDVGAVRFLDHFRDTRPEVIAWTLKRLARERRVADDRYANVSRLVWSGASEDDEAIRDTRVVLDDLFRRAQRHILISTFVIYDGRAIFQTLAEQIQRVPSLDVELYVNLTGRAQDEAEDVADFLSKFTKSHWPSGVRPPMIYYDPETRKREQERTSLHAKCVVVDNRWAFVTSANFTEAAQERNIEAGVLLDHPKLAGALASRFRALRDAGRMRRMDGASGEGGR
jgi:phosphatidylserine/phosphatidylglycerophosphate/cardiolipin synthase-like enzyme